MQERSFSPLSLSLKVFVFSLGVMALPSQAFAGFQWVAPQEAEPAASAAPTTAVITAPSSVSSPIVIESPEVVIDPKAQAAKTPKSMQLPTTMEMEPVAPAPSLAQPSPASVAAPAAKEEVKGEKIVKGFANSVPLAVALRQILPPEYGFSVEQDVNMGSLVSWRGGKGWKKTLSDMLQASNLTMNEQGQMVSISKVRGGDSAPKASALTAPETAPAPREAPISLNASRYETNPSHVLTAPQAAPMDVLAPVETGSSMAPISKAAPVIMNVAPSTEPPTSSLDQIEVWKADRGDTLRKVLSAWCARVGVELSWQAEYDYPIQAPVILTGRFEDVVRTLLKGFEEAQPQPAASLHNNATAGQPVMVVQARGNNYGE